MLIGSEVLNQCCAGRGQAELHLLGVTATVLSKTNRGHALRQGKILFVSREIVYFMT